MDQLLDEPQSWNLYQYVVNNPLRYVDPFGLWRTTPEGFIVWENEDDTWDSLAALLGTTPTALQKFFPNVTLGPDTVLDFAAFNASRGQDLRLRVEWTDLDEEEFRRAQFMAEFEQEPKPEFVAPAAGIRKIIGSTFVASGRTSAASAQLIKNLAQAGVAGTQGAVAHHIVAHSHRLASFAREVLARFGIGINSAENGVYLAGTLHAGIHTTKYFKAVNRLLAQAKTREEVMLVLEYIKTELKNGTFPP